MRGTEANGGEEKRCAWLLMAFVMYCTSDLIKVPQRRKKGIPQESDFNLHSFVTKSESRSHWSFFRWNILLNLSGSLSSFVLLVMYGSLSVNSRTHLHLVKMTSLTYVCCWELWEAKQNQPPKLQPANFQCNSFSHHYILSCAFMHT